MNSLEKISFKEFSHDWLIFRSVDIKETTIKQYELRVQQLNKYFENTNIEDISYSLVHDLFKQLCTLKYAKSTIKKDKNILSQILNYAIEKEIISSNSCSTPKVKKIAHITKHQTVMLKGNLIYMLL